jgi:hypothetical protein
VHTEGLQSEKRTRFCARAWDENGRDRHVVWPVRSEYPDHARVSILLTLQEVRSIYKTCNQFWRIALRSPLSWYAWFPIAAYRSDVLRGEASIMSITLLGLYKRSMLDLIQRYA